MDESGNLYNVGEKCQEQPVFSSFHHFSLFTDLCLHTNDACFAIIIMYICKSSLNS